MQIVIARFVKACGAYAFYPNIVHVPKRRKPWSYRLCFQIPLAVSVRWVFKFAQLGADEVQFKLTKILPLPVTESCEKKLRAILQKLVLFAISTEPSTT